MRLFAIRRRLLRGLVVATCTVAIACDESLQPTGVEPRSGVPQVVAVTPQQLLAQFGIALDTPIRVRVLDQEGRPLRSTTVKYNVVIGAGVFSSDSTLTNDQGFTEVTFRPLSAGMVVVEARVERPAGTGRVQFTIQVLNDPNIATRFEKVSGDGQSAPVGTILASPLVVRLLNGDGFPVDSVPVTFAIQAAAGDSAGVAATRATASFSGQVTVLSDGGGFAAAFVRVGTEAGPHSITATALIGPPGAQQSRTVTFSATAQPSNRVARLIALSGFDQTVVIDTLHERTDTLNFRGRDPRPLILQAVDRFGNPVPGVAVAWFVSDGGGRLASDVTVTNANGIARNEILDVTVGRNVVVAFVPGATAVEFKIQGELYVPPEEGGVGSGGG